MEKMFNVFKIVCDMPPIFPYPKTPIVDEPPGQVSIWVWVVLGVVVVGVLAVGVKLVLLLVQNLKDKKN